jgi:hypothetical protein
MEENNGFPLNLNLIVDKQANSEQLLSTLRKEPPKYKKNEREHPTLCAV